VIGESGVLTKRLRSGTATCETEGVTAYHISVEIMKEALKTFNDPYDSLEVRLWRSCGIRRGSAYFPTTNFYQVSQISAYTYSLNARLQANSTKRKTSFTKRSNIFFISDLAIGKSGDPLGTVLRADWSSVLPDCNAAVCAGHFCD